MGSQLLGAVDHQGARLVRVVQGLAHTTPPHAQAAAPLTHIVGDGDFKWLCQNLTYKVFLLKEEIDFAMYRMCIVVSLWTGICETQR